jgi:hypothetical protein
MLEGCFTLRSWILNVVIGLEPSEHRVGLSATISARPVLGCLSKSTIGTGSSLASLGKNGLGQRALLAGQDGNGGFERGAYAVQLPGAQAQPAAK